MDLRDALAGEEYDPVRMAYERMLATPDRLGAVSQPDYEVAHALNPAPTESQSDTSFMGQLPVALGIFAGPKAKTADLGALKIAQDMHAQGLPREQIWRDTGWGRGADGQWRFEIPDDTSRFKEHTPPYGTVGSELEHPALMAAYPELADIPFSAKVGRTQGAEYVPSYVENGPRISVTTDVPYNDQAKSMLLHELQHTIQEHEGFARGGNPAEEAIDYGILGSPATQMAELGSAKLNALYAKGLRSKYANPAEFKAMDPKGFREYQKANHLMDKSGASFEAYLRGAGETEARNTQMRRDMGPWARKVAPPWYTEDYPAEEQFFRYADNPFKTTPYDQSLKNELAAPPAGWVPRVEPEDFINARNKSTRSGFLSELTPADLATSDLIMNPQGTVGAAVTNRDIGNVFNNGGGKGAGIDALVQAIERGGRTLDAYEGFLPQLYGQLGFVETGRMKFNPEFAHGWDVAKQGTPDVVFMKWNGYPGGDKAAAIKRAKEKDFSVAVQPSNHYYDDWDKAKSDSRISQLSEALMQDMPDKFSQP